MSDLLSPILYVMQNEVDAFWCFVGFMDRVASNFELEQGGMKRQLGQLTHILKYLDLPFYDYLGNTPGPPHHYILLHTCILACITVISVVDKN